MALPQLDPAKIQLVQDLEIEMMSDMYNRMTAACHNKCIPPKYVDAELGKLIENTLHNILIIILKNTFSL